MKLVKSNYDNFYFDTWLEKLPLEKMFNRDKINLICSAKNSGKLLEIGCGRGILLKELEKNYSVSGSDISASAIKFASRLINKSKLKVMNIEKEKIKGKYDIILAFDVLEHLKNPEKAIIKIKNALNKKGVFIFSVPNNYGLFGKMMTSFFNYTDKTHVSTFERNKWIQIIKDCGFDIKIYNQHTFGISDLDFVKHFAFNLVIVCTKN